MSSKKSDKLEAIVAKDFSGGQKTIASGALPFWKHDIQSDKFLIEHKYTETYTKSYSFKRDYFKNLTDEAYKIGRLPMMIVEFLGNPPVKVAVLRYEDAVALDRYLSEDNAKEANVQ